MLETLNDVDQSPRGRIFCENTQTDMTIKSRLAHFRRKSSASSIFYPRLAPSFSFASLRVFAVHFFSVHSEASVVNVFYFLNHYLLQVVISRPNILQKYNMKMMRSIVVRAPPRRIRLSPSSQINVSG